MSFFKPIFPMLLSLLVIACASGPKFSEVEQDLPCLKEGYARIYFFNLKQGVVLLDYKPPITIDGEVVGRRDPGTFFFVDVPPGTYVISHRASKDFIDDFFSLNEYSDEDDNDTRCRKVITVAANETKYIEMRIALHYEQSAYLHMVVLHSAQGKFDIQGLKYNEAK